MQIKACFPLSVIQVSGASITGETLEAEVAGVLHRGDGLLKGTDITDVYCRAAGTTGAKAIEGKTGLGITKVDAREEVNSLRYYFRDG